MIQLFLSFLKIGAISFGGGYGMISVLQEEVLANGWLTSEQLMDFIAVSESTPGPLAINMATFVGASQYGFLGALLATFGVVLPAFIVILSVAALFTNLMKYAGVKSVLKGIRPVVTALVLVTGITMLASVVFSYTSIKSEFSFNLKAAVIFLIIAFIYLFSKKVLRKSVSAVLLIVISAVLGILFYGLI